MDREKVIKGLKNCITGFDCPEECPYLMDCNDLAKPMFVELARDTIALLKEQEAMNVDAFVQWCIDSHIMGDATVSGIKYWVGKYKETKEGR